MLLYAEKDSIRLDPPYQRMGDVWPLEKKQLLIDSIINDYDIPKIYFHIINGHGKSEQEFIYAVIDGRQRLEAIWGFIDGKFGLSEEFEYQKFPTINLTGLRYDDIAQLHPKVKIMFDSFVLPVIGVETEDEDLIEDMFSRLNEAVPLNAAEKRNAFGGEMVKLIRDLSDHDLFTTKVSFTNKRFQHREVAARFLLVESSLQSIGKLVDTKKVYLDAMARNYSQMSAEIERFGKSVRDVLNEMARAFSDGDPLLRSQGNMVVYYLLFRKAISLNECNRITRRKLLDFHLEVSNNRIAAELNIETSSFDLLEFDRLTQQGTNDASNIKERFSVLAKSMGLSETEWLGHDAFVDLVAPLPIVRIEL